MLPSQRNELVIEDAIDRVSRVLNAAENSNQAGEDLIVLMSLAGELYEALDYVMSAHGEQLSDAFERAEKVLLKATGETK